MVNDSKYYRRPGEGDREVVLYEHNLWLNKIQFTMLAPMWLKWWNYIICSNAVYQGNVRVYLTDHFGYVNNEHLFQSVNKQWVQCKSNDDQLCTYVWNDDNHFTLETHRTKSFILKIFRCILVEQYLLNTSINEDIIGSNGNISTNIGRMGEKSF